MVNQYNAQLGLPDKGRTIKVLVVCNIWDLEPLDLLNGMALGCYQPSPEILIVLPENFIDNILESQQMRDVGFMGTIIIYITCTLINQRQTCCLPGRTLSDGGRLGGRCGGRQRCLTLFRFKIVGQLNIKGHNQ